MKHIEMKNIDDEFQKIVQHVMPIVDETCSICGGSGELDRQDGTTGTCDNCGGSGEVTDTRRD